VNRTSAGLLPRSTVTECVSTRGGGSGALTLTGADFGVDFTTATEAADGAASLRRLAAVTPLVVTISLSRRFRMASVSLPSLWARASRSTCAGCNASVTVVIVTGLLSRSSTVWPAARTVTSWMITFEMRS
jgi:hypothetical protein